MKRFRIAFTGVFDLANYGDHLFPIVFQSEMERRNLDFQFFLFSPFACKQAFDKSTDVFALTDLENMHLQSPFDAIIVGGGEVTHFLQSPEKLQIGDKEYREYPISQTWIIPSLMALKYNIPLIWNAPGANSFHFAEPFRWMAQALCTSVDYLSVRNETSRQILLECGVSGEKIQVCPDTALLISDIVPYNSLDTVKDSLLPFSQEYVVFHTNRFLSEEGINAAIDCLDMLQNKGYKVVLLPLAYTHGDELILHEINKRADFRYTEFSKTLSLNEMMSVLACSSLYIGSSFHGCVTSVAYGKKAVVFDIFRNKKTEDLLKTFHLEKYFVIHPQQLLHAVEDILGNDISVDLGPTKDRLKRHFDDIYRFISETYTGEKRISSFIEGYLKSLDSFRTMSDRLSSDELAKAEEISREVVQARQYIAAMQSDIAAKSSYITKKERECLEAQSYIRQLEQSTKQEKQLREEQMEQEKQREKQIAELEAEKEEMLLQMKALSDEMSEMKNTLAWKIRKALHK